jgi:hypothetical protein
MGAIKGWVSTEESFSRLQMMHPKTIDEAEFVRMELINDIWKIQTQISNRDRTNSHGIEVLSEEELKQWRRRANSAVARKLSELRALTGWMKAQYKITRSQQDELIDLVARSYEVLSNIVEDLDGVVEPEEMELVSLLRQCLENNGRMNKAA